MPPAKSSANAVRNSSIPRVAMFVETSTTWGRNIVCGVAKYVSKHGPWQLFLEARGLQERFHLTKGWRGDGIIARVSTPAILRELETLNIPVVNVSGIQLSGLRFPQVTTDLTAFTAMALDHFCERGFKNFAYFSVEGVSYVHAHKDAFVRAVKKRGGECLVYSVKPQAGAEPDWNLDLARLGEWLKGLPKPVGIMTWNASGGREILYACHEAGLLVPEEVAVLSGADDDVFCQHLQPPLSGVAVDAERIGHEAASLLHRLMQGKKAGEKPKLIPPLRVVTRQSTDTLAMDDARLIKAISFIRENAARQIQVVDVARHAGLSRRVLERCFMQSLGRSPASEIRRVHLERARYLLLETRMSIPEVAAASGFGSPEYLAYAFKMQTGVTPLEYRKVTRS